MLNAANHIEKNIISHFPFIYDSRWLLFSLLLALGTLALFACARMNIFFVHKYFCILLLQSLKQFSLCFNSFLSCREIHEK